MEVIRVMGKGGFSLGILIMAMLLLLDASQPGAKGSFLKELRGDTLIADNMELEFLMDSEISSKLASGSHVTDGALIASEANCNRTPYKSCLPGQGQPRKGETCDVYKRENPCPPHK